MNSQPASEGLKPESKIQGTASVVWRRVEDSIVLVHLGTNRTYELNRTGGRLWELLEGGSTYGAALATLRSEFDVGDGQLQSEARELITLLFDEQLAEESHPS